MKQDIDSSSKPIGTREWYDFVGQLSDTIPGIHMGGMDATRKLLAMCEIDGSKRILDVGCGAGHTACLIAQQFGARVEGIDLSEVMISKAKKRAIRMGVMDRVSFRTGDAFNLPFEDGAFDVILVESVLVALPGDTLQALHEMKRVLQPGGLIGDNESIVDPRTPPDVLEAYAQHPATYTIFTPQTLQELFERAGLEEIQLFDTMNIEAPSPIKEMGCGGLLVFMLRSYPKILLTLIRDARFREASRIDDQITKQSKEYTGYALIVGRKPGSVNQ